MNLGFRKKTILDRRIKEIRQEISEVRGEIRALSKGKAPPSRAAPVAPPDARSAYAEAAAPRPSAAVRWRQSTFGMVWKKRGQPELLPKEGTLQTRDERFVDYLATNLQAERPLRYERQIQRNKAIAMTVFVLLVLLWLLYRHLF
jgi:hypothetical protein